jgi:hypothetical protein
LRPQQHDEGEDGGDCQRDKTGDGAEASERQDDDVWAPVVTRKRTGGGQRC